jgi:hypothetical protein|tara:strand:+ start:1184 stop:1951 length:768 start_codon:yes stop_codon:yes gene_type:complete
LIPLPTCNDEAINEFEQWLRRARDGEPLDPPTHLVTEDARGYSSGIELDPNQTFGRRWDVARYFNSIITNVSDWNRFMSDKNALVACTIIYFDSLCKRDDEGTWRIKMDTKSGQGEQFPHYIPVTREERYYRHRVRGPMIVHNNGGEYSRPLLHGPAHQHGDFMEQVTGRPDQFLNPQIMELTYRLYWDQDRMRPHPGWSSTARPRPDGVLRRLFGKESFLETHKWTYDYMSMTTDQLVSMLPQEFDEWLSRGHD